MVDRAEDKPSLSCVHTMSAGLGYQVPLVVHTETISLCGGNPGRQLQTSRGPSTLYSKLTFELMFTHGIGQ